MSSRGGRKADRGGHPQHIGDVLGPTLERLGPKNIWVEARIRRAWPSVVGADIAPHAQIKRLRGSTLVVEVSSDTWATELRYLSRVVLDKLAARFGAGTVSEIVVNKQRGSGGHHRGE